MKIDIIFSFIFVIQSLKIYTTVTGILKFYCRYDLMKKLICDIHKQRALSLAVQSPNKYVN